MTDNLFNYEGFSELAKLPIKEAFKKIDDLLPKDDSPGVFNISADEWDDGSREGGQFFGNITISKEYDNNFEDMDINKVKANSCIAALTYISSIIGENDGFGYRDPEFGFGFNDVFYGGEIQDILRQSTDKLIDDNENEENQKVLVLATYALRKVQNLNSIFSKAFFSHFS